MLWGLNTLGNCHCCSFPFGFGAEVQRSSMISPRGAPMSALSGGWSAFEGSWIECVSSSVQAAMTDYCRFCGLNNRHLVLTIPEAETPRSRSWLIWFLVRTLPVSFCVLKWWRERSRARALVPFPFIRTVILSWGPTLVTSSNPNHLMRDSLQVPSP